MTIRAYLSLFFVLLICSTVSGTDLYRVSVTGHQDAAALASTGVDALLRVPGGYLVLVENEQVNSLQLSGLDVELVLIDVTRQELVLPRYTDDSLVAPYSVVYDHDGVRLLRVDPMEFLSSDARRNIIPILTHNLKIFYKEPLKLDRSIKSDRIDVESVIALINEDSLISYTERLQAFSGRVEGANFASRSWLVNKLNDFGYDSVYLDIITPTADKGGGVWANVVAVKPGSECDLHQVVVGAHYDAVPGSPGADDNGSGVAGVLEMARVLKDIDTRLTYVFILFDAEEVGLYGAWNYANAAAIRNDSLVAMLNMDMIGYKRNDTMAVLHYGEDTTIADLWRDLAATLPGINIQGLFGAASFSSDHYPFQQNGYPVVFAIEHIFSNVYHTYRDSTSYMDFDYMTRMVKATLATAWTIGEYYSFTPGLVFKYPEGVPALVLPGIENNFQFRVEEYGGSSLIPGSCYLQYAFHLGALNTVPVTDLGSGLYQASLPVASIYDRLHFRITSEEASLGTVYGDDGGVFFEAYGGVKIDTVFSDNFEANLGWQVSGIVDNGTWVREMPGWAAYFSDGVPDVDIDGAGKCFITGNDYIDIYLSGGYTILNSPAIDLSEGRTILEYTRWYYNHRYLEHADDQLLVNISIDSGVNWTLLEAVGPLNQSSGGWYPVNFWLNDFVPPSSNTMIQYVAFDSSISSPVKAALDNFRLIRITSEPTAPQIEPVDFQDWTQGIPFSQQLTTTGGAGTLTWTDRDGDLMGTGLEMSTAGLLSGVPIISGPIVFTAKVIDQYDSTDQQTFSFTVNSPLSIVETSIPDVGYSHAYSVQLVSEGGTGNISWQEVTINLSTLGLSLSSDGLLAGQPNDTGSVDFAVLATDQVGAFDQVQMNLRVRVICGDMDFSGSDPDISDLTSLVDYFFAGGPTPAAVYAADVNSSGTLDISDLTYMVQYLFGSGPVPTCL